MALSFEMDGRVAMIVAGGELGREDLPELEESFRLAVSGGARAVLLDVREARRVATSVLGALIRHGRDRREHGTLVGLIGLDRTRNPVVMSGDLGRYVVVLRDADRARLELRRRIGAAAPGLLTGV